MLLRGGRGRTGNGGKCIAGFMVASVGVKYSGVFFCTIRNCAVRYSMICSLMLLRCKEFLLEKNSIHIVQEIYIRG